MLTTMPLPAVVASGGTAGATMMVRVPPGATPGQLVQVTAPGGGGGGGSSTGGQLVLSAVVPAGMSPGDSFAIQLPPSGVAAGPPVVQAIAVRAPDQQHGAAAKP
jgi:hypothetical protein|eukprot:COSAG01_NODE_17302_length_1162_cov_1.158043_1_plen_105_part_00